jgi:magnesium-transporting ATPase (P-type)
MVTGDYQLTGVAIAKQVRKFHFAKRLSISLLYEIGWDNYIGAHR